MTTHATPTTAEIVIDVGDLVKQYPKTGTNAVRGVSFHMRRGEVLGLLGPNGAGKTTTIEILTGFRTATSGRVRVLGLDPGDRRQLGELRRRVGIVLQQTAHYRYLTVRECIDAARSRYVNPRSTDEVLELVGLTDKHDDVVRRLSGGQQRRLDVGVALTGRPELLFLDEPTTGFDPAARKRTWEVIEELARAGTSIVLTTHYMEEASRLADRVVVMGHGQVVGSGTPEDLARDLQLDTVIRARLPFGITHADLPRALRAGLVEPGRFELRSDDPTTLLGALCGWAVERGMSLDELDVRAPSLEESYLLLTERVSNVAEAQAGDVR